MGKGKLRPPTELIRCDICEVDDMKHVKIGMGMGGDGNGYNGDGAGMKINDGMRMCMRTKRCPPCTALIGRTDV